MSLPCVYCGKLAAQDPSDCIPGRLAHVRLPAPPAIEVVGPSCISPADASALAARLARPGVAKAHLVIQYANGNIETARVGPWSLPEQLWLAFLIQQWVAKEQADLDAQLAKLQRGGP